MPRLVEVRDLQGDCHVHSDWSDGRYSVERMAEEARRRGLAYQVLTDHTQSLGIARGLAPARVVTAHRHNTRLPLHQDLHQGADDNAPISVEHASLDLAQPQFVGQASWVLDQKLRRGARSWRPSDLQGPIHPISVRQDDGQHKGTACRRADDDQACPALGIAI